MTEQGITSLRSTVANSEKLPESSRASNPDSNTLTSSVKSAPMLSYIISGPDRSVHLRWTNAIPAENGKSRPDAVISEKPQLVFESSLGYGEAKVLQDSCSKFLRLDTLRLAIFTKNSININKLDGALAFQTHGFNKVHLLLNLQLLAPVSPFFSF
ncbi:hypothetical protein EDC94DRAFT_365042 [Helicostylum pulchrum]|nr:hypothetical protein EDC94DRAFT_365042 [Helicostylum pulchrum]